MGTRDQDTHDVITRVVRLPQDVTWDLFTGPYKRMYRFLHKDGEYKREGTETADEPYTVHEWAEAIMYASTHDAAYIVNFWEKRVHFRIDHANGTTQWFPAAPLLHESIEVLNSAVHSPKNEAGSKKRKYESGAQKRKRQRARERFER